MDASVKEEVLDALRGIRSFRQISFDMYAMRCQLCGDSRKDPNKARFYVKINLKDDSPILYMCHNCQASGILTPEVLRSFDVHDYSLNSRLLKYNKESTKKIKRLSGRGSRVSVKVPKFKNTKRYVLKKQYVESRLGISIPPEDMVRLKAIFSLEDFLNLNHIEEVSTKPKMAQTLHDSYVGFLTTNNEFINFRDITNKNKLRYFKYVVFQDKFDSLKFYTIPNKINLMTTSKITINIAEGIFDILGIYYHITHQNNTDNIYVAVCGCAYLSVIKYYIELGLCGSNIVVNIYSDADKDPYFYKSVIREISAWVGEVHLFYNTLGKDYGVRAEEISIIEKKIPR